MYGLAVAFDAARVQARGFPDESQVVLHEVLAQQVLLQLQHFRPVIAAHLDRRLAHLLSGLWNLLALVRPRGSSASGPPAAAGARASSPARPAPTMTTSTTSDLSVFSIPLPPGSSPATPRVPSSRAPCARRAANGAACLVMCVSAVTAYASPARLSKSQMLLGMPPVKVLAIQNTRPSGSRPCVRSGRLSATASIGPIKRDAMRNVIKSANCIPQPIGSTSTAVIRSGRFTTERRARANFAVRHQPESHSLHGGMKSALTSAPARSQSRNRRPRLARDDRGW